MKKRYLILALALLLLCCGALETLAAENGYSWYCMRQKGHRRPTIEPQFAFVEELDGYFIDKKCEGEAGERVLYLTFDAGYENGNVARVLDTLEKTDTPAAFFVLKHFVEANGDLVTRMQENGYTVANHTAHHKNLSNASPEEIRREITELEECYKEQTGAEMAKYFRPPEGSFSRSMLEQVQQMGYKTVFWSFAYADWDNERQPGEEQAFRCIMDNVHNGAVLLLHPTSGTNAAILERVILTLRDEGYRFGTLEELCAAR